MAIEATGCALWSAVIIYGSHGCSFTEPWGLNATGRKRAKREDSLLQAAGLVWKEVFPWIWISCWVYLPPKNSIAILWLWCIAALLQFPARARALVRCLNIQLPTYIPHPSIYSLNASGLRDSKEDPVCRSRKVTYYVPLESDHSEPPCHCLSCLRASRQAKKNTNNKQWSMASGWRPHSTSARVDMRVHVPIGKSTGNGLIIHAFPCHFPRSRPRQSVRLQWPRLQPPCSQRREGLGCCSQRWSFPA